MRALTSEEIAKFAINKKVNKIKVEDFLSTCHYLSSPDVYYKLELDLARLYNWNAATQSAIRAGIALASK
jgi:hypothetical protein